jgi:hypothetical protein
MKAPNKNPDISNLNYPCYIAPLVEESDTRWINLNFHLIKCNYNKDENKYYCYDCIFEEDWQKERCTETYEERLRTLRTILAHEGDYKHYIDYVIKVENPTELIASYKELLTSGHKGARIFDADGFYCFDKVTNGEYWELFPRKVVIE